MRLVVAAAVGLLAMLGNALWGLPCGVMPCGVCPAGSDLFIISFRPVG